MSRSAVVKALKGAGVCDVLGHALAGLIVGAGEREGVSTRARWGTGVHVSAKERGRSASVDVSVSAGADTCSAEAHVSVSARTCSVYVRWGACPHVCGHAGKTLTWPIGEGGDP